MADRCLPVLGGRFATAADRRYSRQILLAEVGGAGQERLHLARPLLVGHGPLAEIAAEYLCRAGVTGLRHLEASSGPTLFLTDLPRQATGSSAPVPPTTTASRDADSFAPARDGTVPRVAAGTLLHAACAGRLGEVGEVGLGCPCQLFRPVASSPSAPRAGSPPASSGAGEAAFATGAALALEALKHLLGLATRSLLVPGSRMRIDLSADTAVTDSPAIVPAAPCTCGGRALLPFSRIWRS